MMIASRLLEIMLFIIFSPLIIVVGAIYGIADLIWSLDYDYKEKKLLN